MVQPANRRLVTEETLGELVDAAYATAVPANLPARLGVDGNSISDWNLATDAGFYNGGTTTINSPLPGTFFMGMVTVRDNWITQEVWALLGSGPGGGYSYRRQFYGNGDGWQPWVQVYETAVDLAPRYARGSEAQITGIGDGTIQIAAGGAVDGIFKLYFTADQRVQRVTLLVEAHQFGPARVKVLENYTFNGQVVLSNFRVTGDAGGSGRYLLVDVANRNGGTSLTAQGHHSGVVTLATSGFGTTAIINSYQEPFSDTGWQNITYANGWADFDNINWGRIQSRKIGNRVTLRGLTSGTGSTNGVIGTLALGSAPPITHVQRVTCANASAAGVGAELRVFSDGNIQFLGDAVPQWVSLSGVSYLTD